MKMTLEETGFTIEDAEIFYTNFEGREGRFNAEGDRSFCVTIPEDAVPDMEEEGWNIRWRDRADERARTAYTQINVGYKIRPPRIVLISGESHTLLGEDEISMLDWADIISVDLTVRKRPWTNNNGAGIKGWLQSMYVTIAYDRLREKYGV